MPVVSGYGLKPVFYQSLQTATNPLWDQGATIKEQKVRIDRGATRFRLQQSLKALPKGRHVSGNGRVLHIGQTKLSETAATGLFRRCHQRHFGEKTIQDNPIRFGAGERCLARPGDQTAARADHRHIRFDICGRRQVEQRLLGFAALGNQLMPMLRLDLAALAPQLPFQMAGQGDVDVVTA